MLNVVERRLKPEDYVVQGVYYESEVHGLLRVRREMLATPTSVNLVIDVSLCYADDVI